MKFIVEKEFFEKVPNAFFGVMLVRNIDNTKEYKFIEEMLKKETHDISEKYKDIKVKELPEIELYRDAFRNMGINPNKFMSSIEALITRTVKTGFVPNINPLVDLGNALSVKYMIPLGLHDTDKITGDVELRRANSNDIFIPFGASEIETPDEGEFVYISGNEVRTRRWIWRQGENGKIDETVKNVFIPMDGFIENKESVLALQKEFKEILESMGCECKIGYVDKSNNEFEF